MTVMKRDKTVVTVLEGAGDVLEELMRSHGKGQRP